MVSADDSGMEASECYGVCMKGYRQAVGLKEGIPSSQFFIPHRHVTLRCSVSVE